MKRLAAALLITAITLPAHAGFREAERALRAQLGTPTTIPFTGLIRFVTWIVHPKGVHDFQFAIWEKPTGEVTMKGPELNALLRQGLSPDFQPIVRRMAKHEREWTFIYARPQGEMLEVLVLNSDRGDTVLVRAEVNATELAKMISEPSNYHRTAWK